jgi:putative membrane protein
MGMTLATGLLGIFLALWAALAIAPFDRADWALENLLTVATLIWLVPEHRRRPLSAVSLVLVFVFMCLHITGAHYTYAEVPYERWGQELLGLSINGALGWERNNFDRVVHFAFGLLLVVPMRLQLRHATGLSERWSWWLAFNLVLVGSSLYELLEWGAALVVGGDLGMAYLGTQGDEWDAHKDMALAIAGAALALSVARVAGMTSVWIGGRATARQ